MSLLAKLQEDMKVAMKTGQKDRLSVIRMLISDVKNIDLQPQKPTEQEVVAAYAKKLRKSQEEYQKLNRAEEVAKLAAELKVVEEYLPKKASPEETQRLVEDFLSKNPFTEKQVGQAMGAFLKAHGGAVDPAIANQLLKSKLSGK